MGRLNYQIVALVVQQCNTTAGVGEQLDDFLGKPIQQRNLYAILDKWLSDDLISYAELRSNRFAIIVGIIETCDPLMKLKSRRFTPEESTLTTPRRNSWSFSLRVDIASPIPLLLATWRCLSRSNFFISSIQFIVGMNRGTDPYP